MKKEYFSPSFSDTEANFRASPSPWHLSLTALVSAEGRLEHTIRSIRGKRAAIVLRLLRLNSQAHGRVIHSATLSNRRGNLLLPAESKSHQAPAIYMHDEWRNPYRYVCNCGRRVGSEQEPCRTRGTIASSERLNRGTILISRFCREEPVEALGKGGDWGSVWSGFRLRSEETFENLVSRAMPQRRKNSAVFTRRAFRVLEAPSCARPVLPLPIGIKWPESWAPPSPPPTDSSLQDCTSRPLLPSNPREKNRTSGTNHHHHWTNCDRRISTAHLPQHPVWEGLLWRQESRRWSPSQKVELHFTFSTFSKQIKKK